MIMNQQRTDNHGNLFRNLSTLYPSKELKNNGTHINVISLLLNDLHSRKGFGPQHLLENLVEFIEGQEHEENTLQNEVFIYSMLSFICVSQSHDSSYYIQELLRLIWKNTRNFQRLFSEVCRPVKDPREPKYQNSLNKLEFIFRNGVKVRTKDGWVRLVDTPLLYGEKPLMLAARHKRPEAVLLFLRHGAQVKTTWLHFKSALEVLLFAPNQTVVGPHAQTLMSRCIQLFIRAMNSVDRSRLEHMEDEGYYPLHDSWEDLIPLCLSDTPRSLRHLCKLFIRQQLLIGNKLPIGIYQLPLPIPMKDYLDLLRD